VESSPTMGCLVLHCHERLNYTKRVENMKGNAMKMNEWIMGGSQ